jgi:phosphoglycolate phosphatase-like HAD superfamily hydrolase
MIKAVIFDGTLIDSVDSHATSWQDSFRRFGHEFDYEDIRSQIGKGGDQLMQVFCPRTKLTDMGSRSRRAGLFQDHRLSSSPELMEELISRNIDIVLASSAKKDELNFYKKVADIADIVHKETTSDDADASKPEPDIFEAAIKLLPGLARNEIIVVGDSPYDAEAAGKAGLHTVGVLCGGFAEADLRKAGCTAVFLDPAEMLKKLDQWLRTL